VGRADEHLKFGDLRLGCLDPGVDAGDEIIDACDQLVDAKPQARDELAWTIMLSSMRACRSRTASCSRSNWAMRSCVWRSKSSWRWAINPR
jgi:hypothetical protein